MKTKILSSLTFLFILFSLSCKKETVTALKCTDTIENYTAAINTFTSSPSQNSCQSLVNALADFLQTCGNPSGTNTSPYKDLDCSQI